MRHSISFIPPYRWQLGLLFLGLPRGLIAAGLGNLAPRGAHQPLANPCRNADPRQAGGLADQLFLLGEHTKPQRNRLGGVSLGSSHGC
jgi:hypothetical protein